MRFSLRQLQVFTAVAQYNNVSRAAKELNLSQSAASAALAELEQQFEVKLFDRIGKRLQINASGESLRAASLSLLQQAHSLEQQFAGKSEQGDLQVGATVTIGNHLAVPLIASFRQQHPNHHVSLAVENTGHIVSRLLNFELDMALIEGVVQHENLLIEPWQPDQLTLFCHPQHPLTGKQKITDSDWRCASWVLREPGSGTRQAFDHAFADLLPALNIAMELPQTGAIRQAVKLGLGIGCLSAITVADDIARGELVALPADERPLRRQFWLARHREKFVGSALAQWIAHCHDRGHDRSHNLGDNKGHKLSHVSGDGPDHGETDKGKTSAHSAD